MSFSLFTYNTLFNNAADKIGPVLKEYKPDVVCLQEIDTNEANLKIVEKMGYKLADYGNSFIKFRKFFGVATYYNPKKFDHVESTVLYLGSNIIEIAFTILQVILGYKKPKTFLMTELRDKKTRKIITICNIHLYVVGSNALRIRHVKQALGLIKTSNPLVLTGDFNYFPYQRRALENFMTKHGLTEATKNISQTIKFSSNALKTYSLFQKLSLKLVGGVLNNLKIDYIFFRRLKLLKTQRIEVDFSDHFPIVSSFKD
jgi:endonuclease/exonuclease/phosphatase family metal-dependent hydrolase